jgi:WD40 repeat protein
LTLLLIAAVACWAQKPQLDLQTGPGGEVHSVAFSPDRKTFASAGSDMVIKLWDLRTGVELRTLKGDIADVVSVAFSNDGKILASSSWGIIRLWDVATGAELRTLKSHGTSKVTAVAFSPDGRTLASCSWDKSIRLWDFSTGAELRTLSPDAGYVESVAFSTDGKTLASGSWDHTVRLWDVSSGAELRTLHGHSSAVVSVAFSSDGKILASGSWDHTVKLWDLSTGTELHTLAGHSEAVHSVAFNVDGKILASGSGDKTINLWEVSTGAEIHTLKGHARFVYSVTFSPDGKTLASGSQDNTARLWDVSTATLLRTLERRTHRVNSVAFSGDGRTLASDSGNSIRLWDLSTGAELRSLREQSTPVYSVEFSADGKTLATGNDDSTVSLWDVATGTIVRTLKGHAAVVTKLAFSRDSKTLASTSANYSIKLWDVSTGAELRTFKGHTGIVASVILSRDGKTLASGSWDKTIKLWDSTTGAELRTLKAHSFVETVAFSTDEKTLASGGFDDNVTLWDISTGRELRTLKGHLSVVESVAFTKDGKILASGSQDRTVKLWDVSTGAELRTLSGHVGMISSIAFSPNNKYLVSGSDDGSVKVWGVSSGKELASLITLDERDWLVVTPEGLFDGSPAAWNKIIWRFGNSTFNYAPVEAFFSDYFYPDLLTDIFADKPPSPPSDIALKDLRQPNVKLELTDDQSSAVSTRKVRVRIEITDAPAGAQDLRLFRNGTLVQVWHGDLLKGQNSTVLQATIPISIVAGENRLTAYAFNKDNIKSADAELVITGANTLKRTGTAYILTIGINEYANSAYNLRYAVADSQAFAEEMRRQQSRLDQYADVKIVSLTDKEATKLRILGALKTLQAQVQPEDALVIYFAGHGTAQQNRFYLIPHDLGYSGLRTSLDRAGLQSVLSHSISDRELEDAVEGIDAGRLLLVIDACNSGQALEAEERRRGPMNSKGLAQLAYEKGMYILTAAQSYQSAQEASRLGHGYLTYALVEEGLKSATADNDPKDHQVFLREWLNFATARVPEMQLAKVDEQKKQGRQLEHIIAFAEGDKSKERQVQRPRVFYRREAERLPLVVARP